MAEAAAHSSRARKASVLSLSLSLSAGAVLRSARVQTPALAAIEILTLSGKAVVAKMEMIRCVPHTHALNDPSVIDNVSRT